MNKKQKFIITFVSIFIACYLFSNTSTTYAAAPIAIKATSSYLVKGETTNLTITGTSQKAAWTSSNKKVATVTSSGKVTAVSYGTATIKATVNKKTYSCKISVVDPLEIYLAPSDTTVMVGGTEVSLNPESFTYSAAAIKKMALTYKVSGNTGVKVSSTGKVTATKAGSFKVTAYVHGKKIGTVSMEAAVFSGFSVSEVPIDVKSSKELKFADGFTPEYQRVEVSSSDTKVAEVEVAFSTNDLDHCYGIEITGIADGTATVTVSVSGAKRQIKVVVGVGATVLPPVEAVKNQDYTGYSGNSLTTLQWVRQFIDTNNLMSDSMSDREKVTIIQDYLNRTYLSDVNDTTFKGTISCILFDGGYNKVADCGPYTDTFCFLCECISLDVYYCSGSADNGNGRYLPHAWNKVKADGVWYYIDTYWNACTDNYNYFLSETLWSDHKLFTEGHYSDIIRSDYAPYIYDID